MKCNLQSRYGKPHIQEEATHHLFWGGEDGMTKQHRRPKQQRLRLPERASRETTRDKPRRPVWGRKKDKRHFPSSFSLQKHYKKTKKNASSSSSGPVFGASGSSIEAACRSGRTRHLRKAGTEPILSLSPWTLSDSWLLSWSLDTLSLSRFGGWLQDVGGLRCGSPLRCAWLPASGLCRASVHFTKGLLVREFLQYSQGPVSRRKTCFESSLLWVQFWLLLAVGSSAFENKCFQKKLQSANSPTAFWRPSRPEADGSKPAITSNHCQGLRVKSLPCRPV